MKVLKSLLRGSLAPFFAGVLGLVYAVAVGFRGVDSRTLDWLQQSRELAEQFAASPSTAADWSAQSVSLLELFATAVYLLFSGSTPEWALVVFSLLAAAVSTAMVFFLTRRLAGPMEGWVSLFFLFTIAPWLGAFTRLEIAVFSLPIVLGVLIAWYAREVPWWARTAICAPLLVIGTLLWPPMVLVVAILVAVDLLSTTPATPADRRGLIDGPSLELDRAITPLVAVVLFLAYPLFWPDPVASAGQFFIDAMAVTPAEFVFRGSAYPPARPPLFTGGAWVFEQLPLALAVASTVGILWCFARIRRRLALSLAAMSVMLLMLPVLLRTPRPFGLDFAPLFLATSVPLASLATRWFFTRALGPDAPSTRVRQIAIATFLLAGASIIFEAQSAIESPESFRSPMTARLTGWSASGDMPMRHDVLPLRIIDYSGADRNRALYTGGWSRHLEVYERMGLLDGIATTSNADSADVAIRAVPPVTADAYSSYPARYLGPLKDTETELVPELHRPLFLIDRTDAD